MSKHSTEDYRPWWRRRRRYVVIAMPPGAWPMAAGPFRTQLAASDCVDDMISATDDRVTVRVLTIVPPRRAVANARSWWPPRQYAQ